MRTALLLGLFSVLAASTVACAVEQAGSDGVTRRHSADQSGDDDDSSVNAVNDGLPSEGENQVDPGNPNATSKPAPPTTTGVAAPTFALALADNAQAVDIGDEVDLSVNITPQGAFNGSVALVVAGLPAGATASPVTTTVTGTQATAKVTIKVGFNTPASATGTSNALTITGTSGAQTATATATFKVNPKVTLTIPMNIDALRKAGTAYNDAWGTAFGQSPTTLLTQSTNPIVVNVFNADSKGHIIHAGNDFGGHGDQANAIQPNTFEQQNGGNRNRTLKPGVKAVGYPHDGQNGAGVSFHMNIGTAP